MKTSLRLLAALNAAFFLAALGCGDEGGSEGGGEAGGCGPAPSKKEEPAAPGGGMSGKTGGGSGAAELITSDRRGRVPKAYQRPTSKYEPGEKSTATISKPVIVRSTAAAAGASKPAGLAVARVTKRGLDGVKDRVEINCRIMATSPDGQCASAPNYSEIKERCCPGGLVERCRTSTAGVVLVGRGCEPAK